MSTITRKEILKQDIKALIQIECTKDQQPKRSALTKRLVLIGYVDGFRLKVVCR